MAAPYAAGYRWFQNNDALDILSRRYVKFGRIRRLEPDAFQANGSGLRQVVEIGHVPVYAVATESDPPSLLLVLVQQMTVWRSIVGWLNLAILLSVLLPGVRGPQAA